MVAPNDGCSAGDSGSQIKKRRSALAVGTVTAVLGQLFWLASFPLGEATIGYTAAAYAAQLLRARMAGHHLALIGAAWIAVMVGIRVTLTSKQRRSRWHLTLAAVGPPIMLVAWFFEYALTTKVISTAFNPSLASLAGLIGAPTLIYAITQLAPTIAAIAVASPEAQLRRAEKNQPMRALYEGRSCYQCGHNFSEHETTYEHLGLRVCQSCARKLKIL